MSSPQNNPDILEVVAGTTHEQLEGWVPELAGEEEVRQALEKAFDYRGDVTITLKNGSKLEGYIFDRRPGHGLSDSTVRRSSHVAHRTTGYTRRTARGHPRARVRGSRTAHPRNPGAGLIPSDRPPRPPLGTS